MADADGWADGWSYGPSDDEPYRGFFSTREEAIDAAHDDDDIEGDFYVIRGKARSASYAITRDNVRDLLDSISENASDDGDDDARAELIRFLRAWAHKHVGPFALWKPIGSGTPEKVEADK